MKVKAQSKYQRISFRKVKRILDLIRNKRAREAEIILSFLPHSAARYIESTLKSAVANAKNNYKLNGDNLIVSECYCGPSTPLKRFQPRARGRAFHILKRATHITIFVEER